MGIPQGLAGIAVGTFSGAALGSLVGFGVEKLWGLEASLRESEEAEARQEVAPCHTKESE
jgi:hypothetical protein